MSSIIGRSAFRATRALRASGANAGAGKTADQDRSFFRRGMRQDPELYILLTIMTGASVLVGWHFGRKPTSSTSEAPVAKAVDSEPWKSNSNTSGKYQYYPGGDINATPKDAPSALNEVIIPNVNLPKSLHDKFNKYGKEDY